MLECACTFELWLVVVVSVAARSKLRGKIAQQAGIEDELAGESFWLSAGQQACVWR